jgi:hypothetical protein
VIFPGAGVGIIGTVGAGVVRSISDRQEGVAECDLLRFGRMPVVTAGKNWVGADEGRPSLERARFILG